MLAEELKPPKRSRNPQHNWIEQKKKEGEKKNQHRTSIPEKELWRRKRTYTLGSHLTNREIKPKWRELKISKKSTAAGLRAKQSESHTDHLHHHCGHHSLRPLGGGWALRLRLWRSVLERGQRLTVETAWGAKEQCSMGWGAECYGLRDRKPQPSDHKRRSGPTGEARCHCCGGWEEKVWTSIGLSLYMHRLSEDGAPLAQATTGERPLTWATGDWVPLVWATSWGPLVWAKGSRGWGS